MAKISSYSQITTPTSSDLLLGTDVGDDNKTKNFPIADLGAVLGLPLRVTKTLTVAELMTLKSNYVTILSNVGMGKLLSIESVYARVNFATTVYDFTADIGVSVEVPNVYAVRSFLMVKEFANLAGTAQRKLEPTYLGDVVGGGQGVGENGGIFIQGDTGGTNPTQGDSTMTLTVFYRLFDTNMIPLTS
tara:strand:+ start:276 stop:842 length:567 start_codon:yes stop_codon:yes gene_type:complete